MNPAIAPHLKPFQNAFRSLSFATAASSLRPCFSFATNVFCSAPSCVNVADSVFHALNCVLRDCASNFNSGIVSSASTVVCDASVDTASVPFGCGVILPVVALIKSDQRCASSVGGIASSFFC